jgi:hypothetical protein
MRGACGLYFQASIQAPYVVESQCTTLDVVHTVDHCSLHSNAYSPAQSSHIQLRIVTSLGEHTLVRHGHSQKKQGTGPCFPITSSLVATRDSNANALRLGRHRKSESSRRVITQGVKILSDGLQVRSCGGRTPLPELGCQTGDMGGRHGCT